MLAELLHEVVAVLDVPVQRGAADAGLARDVGERGARTGVERTAGRLDQLLPAEHRVLLVRARRSAHRAPTVRHKCLT
ncbi:hypothetical protein [Barrientosiimonas endolithica]|uniref:hypothetical protein n=1 Tax=Barrientosiimonas endolithica TaxID=1535208 RepID=UPI00259BE8A1|nr:hypothetical protein [Barrientosiimonas endolithica]